MRCPYCGKAEATAVKCWEAAGSVRRLRVCPACKREFATGERIEPAVPTVVKRDGRREPFDRGKLARSVELACIRRPVSAQTIASLVERVEARLGEAGGPEVASQAIGERVLEELGSLDEVAYLRYASYLRAFASAAAFAEAAEALQAWRQRSALAKLQLPLDFEADQPHWA